MRNTTQLDLIFRYNEVDYEVPARRSHTANVEAGNYISVRDPHHTKVTRKKITVEPDLFTSILDRNITIECDLVAWQLGLHIGSDII